jgi:hypothetical protein
LSALLREKARKIKAMRYKMIHLLKSKQNGKWEMLGEGSKEDVHFLE